MAELKRQEAIEAHKAICEKVKRTTVELNNVTAAVQKLKSAQRACTDSINALKDDIQSNEATSADVFVSNKNYLLTTNSVLFSTIM